MRLTGKEEKFLIALAREQNQSGCKGPAHDLLRRHIFPDAPLDGPHSLAFSYEVVPLTTICLRDYEDLEALDEFVRKNERVSDPEWPWTSNEHFRERLQEARKFWENKAASKTCHSPATT